MKEKWIQWAFCRIPVFLIMVVFLGVLFVHFGQEKNEGRVQNKKWDREEEEKFLEYTKEMFRKEAASDSLTLNYTLSDPQRYGVKGETGFGTYSVEAMEEGVKYAETMEEELKKIDRDLISPDSRFLYDILIDEFENCREQGNYIYFSEMLRPKSGVTAQLPILLAEFHFYEEKNIEEYLELLSKLPAYFDEILNFEKIKLKKGIFMDDDWAGEVIAQCREFASSGDKNILISSFDERLKEAVKVNGAFSLEKKSAKEYKKLNKEVVEKEVFPAFKKLGDGIEDMVKERKQGGSLKGVDKAGKKNWEKSVGNPQGLALYENGREYYRFMVKNTTGSGKDVEALDGLLDEVIKSQQSRIRQAFLDEETLELYDKNLMPEGEPKELLSDLQLKMEAFFTPLSQAASDNNYRLGEDIYTLKYVDKSMEDILSPAFYLTPALDNFDKNVIYINKKKMKKEESLYATLGHEAYPGHMYQMVYFDLKQKNPLRYILNFPGYSEGWGTYAEVCAYEMAGLPGKMKDVEEGSLILNLSIFGKMDMGVNFYGWNEADLKDYLKKLGIAKNVDIPKVYRLMVQEPCMYLKYIVGYLEIMELKAVAKNRLGEEYSDKWFHDFFLSTGPAPYYLISKSLKTGY